MAPIRIDLHTLVRYWLVSPFTCAVLATLLSWPPSGISRPPVTPPNRADHGRLSPDPGVPRPVWSRSNWPSSRRWRCSPISHSRCRSSRSCCCSWWPRLAGVGRPAGPGVGDAPASGRPAGCSASCGPRPLRALTHPVAGLSPLLRAVSLPTTSPRHWRPPCVTSGCSTWSTWGSWPSPSCSGG